MAQQKENNDKAFSPQQIEELTAIYDDYLYFVRHYEKMLQIAKIRGLVQYQFEKLYPNEEKKFPWKLEPLSYYEAKHFDDFIDEKIHHKTGKAYIILQHTNPAEDKNKPLMYVPQSYILNMMEMPLPSTIERYLIVSPQDAKIGNTTFYIDGFYKAVYTRKDREDEYVAGCLHDDEKVKAEFRALINCVDGMRKQQHTSGGYNPKEASNAYAVEATYANENNILEVLGSFAEKLQNICRHRYNTIGKKETFDAAQRDGIIGSATDFVDYVNIRNLMQHQWDTMDELGYFNAAQANKNSAIRAERVKSYLKLCDKPVMERMKAYIDVLRQMQDVIYKINPHRVIRGITETNSKFADRLKAIYRQNPEAQIVAELNYPLASDKYKTLNKNLHKIIPQIAVVDEFLPTAKFEQLEQDYILRAWYLQTHHSLACRWMTYSIMRGHDYKKNESWEDLKTTGILSPRDIARWKDYSDLRNKLSHNYFNSELRQQLHRVERKYYQDINELTGKLFNLYPDVHWIEKGVYEYMHKDGQVIRLDFNNREMKNVTPTPVKSELKVQGKIELNEKMHGKKMLAKAYKESYSNGLEYSLSGNKITALKLPNGVRINLIKQRISWDIDVSLHTNAEYFNVLQTAKCKLLMDKDLRVTEYLEKNRNQPFRYGDIILLDYRHRASLDTSGRLRDFRFKGSDGKITQTGFKYSKGRGTTISFADGTNILLQNGNMQITHGDKVLSYDNRQEFAAGYDGIMPTLPQISKDGNGR